jgi:plastocyanin
MRTPLLAVVLGLSLVGCVGDAPGGPGTGGDDDVGPGPGPGSDPVAVPKLDVSLDKQTLPAELLSTNMVTVTLHGSGGFAGSVSLAASAVDAAGTAIPGWTVTLDKTSAIDVAKDGTVTAVATLKIPSLSTATDGMLKVIATSAGFADQTISTPVTVAKQLALPMAVGNGTTCGVSANPQLTIAVGTKVVWKNADPAKRVTIHMDNKLGFQHEPDPGMAPAGTTGDTYERTAAAAGQITWYCHAPGQDANRYTITIQ